MKHIIANANDLVLILQFNQGSIGDDAANKLLNDISSKVPKLKVMIVPPSVELTVVELT